ncbi:Leucine-rich repeat protein SHOC-2 [Phytophthora citrophthora]|uniref:Leucine-rich repeat protein SHOC-2 n=1 Tax=Phytophthora citrophthora TaxID=4793 RepID=A0AAD9GR59_9STRA|nr:Leucine-rich repeat protein SHOC-2 [Phytophthora citrophthora]
MVCLDSPVKTRERTERHTIEEEHLGWDGVEHGQCMIMFGCAHREQHDEKTKNNNILLFSFGSRNMSSVWEEAYDETSGRAYYFNRQTGETSWTLPGEATSEAATENVWQQSFDEASQTIYYYNIHTGETSWTLPEDTDAEIDLSYLTFAVVRLQSMFRGGKERKRTRRLVKAQYQCTIDSDSGRILYTHLDSNISSWTKPALFNSLGISDGGGNEEEDSEDDDFEQFQQEAEDADEEEIEAEMAENEAPEVELDEATKRKMQRKYPRSKAQKIVDEAEDAEEKVQILDMSGLEAWKLSSRIWNLPFLTKLVLSRNCLSRIPSGIQDLIHLEELDVSHNQLTRLPSCLQTTTSLTSIRASHNLIQTFSPKLWKLRDIRYLDLSHNRLKELPYVEGDLKLLRETREWQVGIGLLVGLQVLLLNNNRLAEVPKSIEKCTELTLLDLSDNQLVSLSDEIPALVSLQRLVLHHNAVRSLPEAIGNLVDLQELDLAHNRLLTLPESIGALHKLENLQLFSNQLRLLPKEFGALSQLCHLDLDNNPKLINLEEFFRHLSSIKFFSASSCGIVTFESLDFLKDSPVETLRLRQNSLQEFALLIGHAAMQDTLLELDLAGNYLTQVPLAVLLYCSHLQKLDLSNNSLRGLPTEIAHLRRLKILNISTNNLQELPDELTQLPRLRELYCDHNQLQQLPLRLGNLTHLAKFNVSFNRLRSLPTSLMELTELQSLYANDNLLVAPPPAIFKCYCDFSNNPFADQQNKLQQDRRNHLALAMKCVDTEEFENAEKLLSQLISEVKALSYVDQKRDNPQLHYKRGLCRFMLLKQARKVIDETSAEISAYEQEVHGNELIHTRELRLKARHKKTNVERPESPTQNLPDNNEVQPEDSAKESYSKMVQMRAEARQKYQIAAQGALKDLQEAIESNCIEITTAHHLKGLTHMALQQYPDAIRSLTEALKCVHAPLPEINVDNQEEHLVDESQHVLTIPEASIQLFLCRAEAYRSLGQLPSAIADIQHVLSHYPIQHDNTSVATLAGEYHRAWEAEQAGYNVDDAALLGAFDIEAVSGLARRPEVFDIQAEALAAAAKKKKSGNQPTKRLPPAERFRLDCKLHEEELLAERKKERAPYEEIRARSKLFLARARDFKREIRANLQMEMEERQQRNIEREIALEKERRRLELQREVDEKMMMKYEDEWMHWFVSEELRIELERQRRADEAQRRANAKVAYAARLSKRGGKRQAAVNQRGKGNSRR